MKIVYNRGCKNQCKTGNIGTGNGMRGTRGIGEMLYSGECGQTFRGMSSNISGNVAKHSGECPQTFRGMSPNILGNVAKYSGKCRQTFWGMSPNIPGNIAKHSGECPRKIQIIFENNLRHVVKHSVESMKGFGWMYIIALDTGDHELYLFVEEPLLIKSTSNQLG